MPVLGWCFPCLMPLSDPLGAQLSCYGVVDVIPVGPTQVAPDAPEEFKDVRYALPQFFLCSGWFGVQGEEGKTFVQRLSVVAPDEKETPIQDETTFIFTTPVHRIIHLLPGIGLRMTGPYQIRVYGRATDETEWKLCGGCPILAVDPGLVQSVARDSAWEETISEAQEPTT